MVKANLKEISEFDCLVIGDAMYDINLKLKNTCSIVRGGTSYSDEAKYLPGGSGNVAVALSFFGVRTALVGKVGNDIFGRLFNEDLERSKLTSYLYHDPNLQTGVVISLIDNTGERSFIVQRGANDKLNAFEVKTVLDRISHCKYLYLSGYSLASPPQSEAILFAADEASKLGAKVVFDTGSFNLIKQKRDLFDKILRYTSVLCPNEEEAKGLAETDDLFSAARMLVKEVPTVVIKCGKKGCLLCQEDKIIELPSYTVRTNDTTGAGDAFVGGLIYCLIHQLPLVNSCKFANWFAARNVKEMGSRALPSISEVQRFMDQISINNEPR